MSQDGSSRSERRSFRHHAERRRRAGRLFQELAPAAALILVLAVMFPLLASPGQQGEGAGGTPAVLPDTTLASDTTAVGTAANGGSGASASAPASPPGSALLVIEQNGAAASVALLFAGPKGGLVLALPGVTLLRSGDRFAQIARLYAPDKRRDLAQPLADVLAVPVGAVASVEWSDLRDALANKGIDPLPSEPVDPKDADTAELANALATMLGKRDTNGGDLGWDDGRLAGDVEGFGAAVHAALLAAQGNGWTGQAVTGTLVASGDVTYLEPDVKTARSALVAMGAGK
jgi:hypothetical protein